MGINEISVQLNHYLNDQKVGSYKLRSGKSYVGGCEECTINLKQYSGADKLVLLDLLDNGDVRIEALSNDILVKINDVFSTSGLLKDKDTLTIGKEKFEIRIIRGFKIDAKTEAKYGYTLEMALFWGDSILNVANYIKRQPIFIGETNRSKFKIPDELLGTSEYQLITTSGNDFYINLSNPDLEGRILIGNEIYTIKEFRNQKIIGDNSFLKITPETKCRLFFKHLSLLITFTPLEKPIKKSYFQRFDLESALFFSISLILHIAFMVIINLIPEEELTAHRIYYQKNNPMLKVLIQENKRKQELIKEKEKKKKIDIKDAKNIKKKKVGDDDMKIKKNEVKKKQDDKLLTSKLTPKQLKERNKQIALNSGANKFLKQQTDLVSSVIDSGLSDWGGPGSKGMRVIGSIGGPGAANSLYGGNSFDPFGGIGGQHTGGGFRATALSMKTNFGQNGMLADLDKNAIAKNKGAKIKFKGKNITKLKVYTNNFNKQGNLDKKTIEKIIRRHMAEIKWCYQEQLQRQPNLEGKIKISFTISPTGSILKVKIRQTTIHSSALEQCVVKKIGRWHFPEPYGGGVVIVNYPFIFKTIKL